ncbi:hypothetical protein HELRODRAFT_184709, partial [Helobdella robusta]|uniref:Uncharacterized protein n=1 Tax=Helobdella robusta TaxID=6412 RepID=T1FLT9_HELRO
QQPQKQSSLHQHLLLDVEQPQQIYIPQLFPSQPQQHPPHSQQDEQQPEEQEHIHHQSSPPSTTLHHHQPHPIRRRSTLRSELSQIASSSLIMAASKRAAMSTSASSSSSGGSLPSRLTASEKFNKATKISAITALAVGQPKVLSYKKRLRNNSSSLTGRAGLQKNGGSSGEEDGGDGEMDEVASCCCAAVAGECSSCRSDNEMTGSKSALVNPSNADNVSLTGNTLANKKRGFKPTTVGYRL